MLPSEYLPRVFQTNVDRLLQQVMRPVIELLPAPVELHMGEATSMDEFLDRAKAQTDNYTLNETTKAFALILAGLFERQLRIWARTWSIERSPKDLERLAFNLLLAECGEHGSIDLNGRLGQLLNEMFLVANAFRHGDGTAVRKLRVDAPHLWIYDRARYVDILPPNTEESEQLLLTPEALLTYAHACILFWGEADKLPGGIAMSPML